MEHSVFMTKSLDLILLPLFRKDGQDLPEIPGLFASQAEGRVARGRSQERLVIHFSMSGNAPFSPVGYKKLVNHLAKIYFKTSGSSTSAMKIVGEWLNSYLFERNKRGAKRSLKSTGYLTMVVVRAGRIYISQCGDVHAFFMSSDKVSHFSDQDQVGRGLGYTKKVHIQYKQMGLSPGDSLLISPNPSANWTLDLLTNLKQFSLDEVNNRLRQNTGTDLDAVLLCVGGRTGQLRVLRPVFTPEGQVELDLNIQETSTVIKKKRRTLRARKRKIRSQQALISQATDLPKTRQEVPPLEEADDSKEADLKSEPAEIKEVEVLPPPEKQITISSTEAAEDESGQPVQKPVKTPVIMPILTRIGQAVIGTVKEGFRILVRLLGRMLPDEGLFSVPKNFMAVIAVLVPVIVVGVAAATYFQRGQAKLYDQYYLQAEYAAEQAIHLTEASLIRLGWNDVIGYLDQAEGYQVTEDSQALRTYAQSELDTLDSVTRLPFQSALAEKLPGEVVIKRIVTADEDNVLYLLNETNGHVLRAVLGDKGYALDSNFLCEPVPQPLIVGPLVDIIPLPLGNDENAEVMGMDANGNLMECIPGGKPPLTSQMPPPDMHWGEPTAFEINSIGLFVLDPITNAVWIFWSADEFSELPTLYFDEQVPRMGDVIDLAVNRQDLFLLHLDGHLTTCVSGNPTRCVDPAVINDIREDRQLSEVIADTGFREIQYTSPPDPSIYLLDPDTPAIYHLSVRLTYQRQFRPQNQLAEGQATAFTVTSKHQVFMAIGNMVYYSPLP
jgi:hypothetical protein